MCQNNCLCKRCVNSLPSDEGECHNCDMCHDGDCIVESCPNFESWNEE